MATRGLAIHTVIIARCLAPVARVRDYDGVSNVVDEGNGTFTIGVTIDPRIDVRWCAQQLVTEVCGAPPRTGPPAGSARPPALA